MIRSSKYHNIKTGKSASRKEEKRRRQLELMERAGEIHDLRCQVPYVLIPAQYVDGRCAERSCKYVADFVYKLKDADGNWHEVVEDTKGFRTPEYKIKRKLMLLVHGIRIIET